MALKGRGLVADLNCALSQVWGDAAVQVFYSLSTCTGGIIMLSSYNRFHNNLFSDVWIISISGWIFLQTRNGFISILMFQLTS